MAGRGRPSRASVYARLDQALVGTGFPFKLLTRLDEYLTQLGRAIQRTAGVRRAGSAALDLCHLASGYFDGFWELYLSPWDFAAGTLIIREAGGVVTNLEGDPDVLSGSTVLAGNPAIHPLLQDLVGAAG
jgi:myo-inositol-1(or 4)-monophosphatase